MTVVVIGIINPIWAPTVFENSNVGVAMMKAVCVWWVHEINKERKKERQRLCLTLFILILTFLPGRFMNERQPCSFHASTR